MGPWTTPLAFATEAVRAGVRLRLGTRVTGVDGPARTAECMSLATTRGQCDAAGRSTRPGWAATDRPDVRRRRVHDPAAPRRADRVRQAGPAAGAVDPAAGPDGADEGGARRAHRVRQRAARADRGRRARPPGHVHDGGRASAPAGRAGGGSCPGLARRRSPRPTPGCGPLPSTATTRSGPGAGTRGWPASGRPACPRRSASPSTSWTGSAGGPAAARRGRALGRAAGHALPRGGRAAALQDAERIAADPAYGEIVCHCERVTRGEIRDALASESRPRTSTACGAGPAR